MVLPQIEKGQIVVLCTERATGIILNNDNSYYLQSGNNNYKVFDSIEEVRNHISELTHQNYEFIIYTYNGETITL